MAKLEKSIDDLEGMKITDSRVFVWPRSSRGMFLYRLVATLLFVQRIELATKTQNKQKATSMAFASADSFQQTIKVWLLPSARARDLCYPLPVAKTRLDKTVKNQ